MNNYNLYKILEYLKSLNIIISSDIVFYLEDYKKNSLLIENLMEKREFLLCMIRIIDELIYYINLDTNNSPVSNKAN